jgi:phosphatidylserine/phosphatidylglycerophosphate/cardiolipin synthase-like enzyme
LGEGEMSLKKSLRFFGTVFFLVMLSNVNSWGFEAKKIEFLIDSGYFPEVKRLINSAKKSVQVMMFEASYYKEYPGSPSNQLIEAVVDARKRGLKVEVILEIKKKTERTTKRNMETGQILKKAGVEVIFDPEQTTTHTKLVIIDGSIVVLGSTNWTYNGLTKNHEISSVIYSEESAKHLQDYFRVVKSSGKKL